jgi:hypothetical protein
MRAPRPVMSGSHALPERLSTWATSHRPSAPSSRGSRSCPVILRAAVGSTVTITIPLSCTMMDRCTAPALGMKSWCSMSTPTAMTIMEAAVVEVAAELVVMARGRVRVSRSPCGECTWWVRPRTRWRGWRTAISPSV